MRLGYKLGSYGGGSQWTKCSFSLQTWYVGGGRGGEQERIDQIPYILILATWHWIPDAYSFQGDHKQMIQSVPQFTLQKESICCTGPSCSVTTSNLFNITVSNICNIHKALSLVWILMFNQVAPTGEKFNTFLALKRLLSNVDFPMDEEELSFLKGFPDIHCTHRPFPMWTLWWS